MCESSISIDGSRTQFAGFSKYSIGVVGFKETISFALAVSAIEHPIEVVGSIMDVPSVEVTDPTKTVVFGVG